MKTLTFLFLTVFCCVKAAVYDCFTFFNELDLLETRLNELYDVVDKFVLVESPISFTGKDKPLYFHENRDRFRKYMDKIIYLRIDNFPDLVNDPEKDHWYREAYSRNYIMNGLKGCSNDDIIFLSDVDEIPRKTSLAEIVTYLNNLAPKRQNISDKSLLVCGLEMRLFMYFLNCENKKRWYGGSKATFYDMIKTITPWDFKIYHHNNSMTKFENAGWHLNTMGGKDKSLYKWLNTGPVYYEGLEKALFNLAIDENLLETSFNGHRVYNTVTISFDEDYPDFIKNNLSYFESIGWIYHEE